MQHQTYKFFLAQFRQFIESRLKNMPTVTILAHVMAPKNFTDLRDHHLSCIFL
jgi:hypothetical protein